MIRDNQLKTFAESGKNQSMPLKKKTEKSKESGPIKIFSHLGKRPVSDIIAPIESFSGIKKSVKLAEEPEMPAGPIGDEHEDLKSGHKKDFFETPSSVSQEPLVEQPFRQSAEPKKLGRFLFASFLAVLAGVGVYVAVAVLPKVDIKISLQKKSFDFNESVNASLKSSDLPIELFTQKGNLQFLFPASNKKKVEIKAKGEIIIYNAYSSQPQSLVATTRFLTPDNKIFRLDQAITVPGAKVVNGKITPSSIAAAVTADKPGEEYNVGPIARLSIPGFKNSPKYENFYGEIKESVGGGFIGEAAVPTAEELKTAKTQMSESLKETLRQRVLNGLPSDFKALEGGQDFKILKEEINYKVPEPGRFGIFLDSQFQLLAFKESDIKTFFVNKALGQLDGNYDVLSSGFEYGAARSDFAKGILSFPVKAKISLRRAFDIENFRTQAAGKKETELKTLIFSLPGLENGKISFWPFWVSRAPRDLNRIAIDVE
ncbi:MAG: hypothetical protein HYW34_02590 [Candidatus Brennerbacteria bacterium]|nr:hypothetical protein [Candidatus Brennerbacteria bacterium]